MMAFDFPTVINTFMKCSLIFPTFVHMYTRQKLVWRGVVG